MAKLSINELITSAAPQKVALVNELRDLGVTVESKDADRLPIQALRAAIELAKVASPNMLDMSEVRQLYYTNKATCATALTFLCERENLPLTTQAGIVSYATNGSWAASFNLLSKFC